MVSHINIWPDISEVLESAIYIDFMEQETCTL